MPLKDRDARQVKRLSRLGVVRLGHTEEKIRDDGRKVKFPVPDDHFVLTDAPALLAAYGDCCRSLPVIFVFDEVERAFRASYSVWAGGINVCSGDGEFISAASSFRTERNEKTGAITVHNAPGGRLVEGGLAVRSFTLGEESFKPGDRVKCSGSRRDLYPHCRACKASALLKFTVADPQHKDLLRLGYYQLATGSGRNYDSIDYTLKQVYAIFGKISWIPMTLRLVLESTIYEDKSRGGIFTHGERWFVQLEPTQEVVRQMYLRATKGALIASPGGALAISGPADPSYYDDDFSEGVSDWEEDAPLPPPHAGQRAAQEDPSEGQVLDGEPVNPGEDPYAGMPEPEYLSAPAAPSRPAAPASNPASAPAAPGRPYAPFVVKDRLATRAAHYAGKAPTDKQYGIVAMLLEMPFAGDGQSKEKRHAVQLFLFGQESLRDAGAGAVLAALNDWLKPVKDSGGNYSVDAMAAKEIVGIWDEIAAQAPLASVEPPAQPEQLTL